MSETIGERLRRHRQRAGLTLAEVGRRLDPPRSHPAVSNLERGVTAPSPEVTVQLARIYGVTNAGLLGWVETDTVTVGRTDLDAVLSALWIDQTEGTLARCGTSTRAAFDRLVDAVGRRDG